MSLRSKTILLLGSLLAVLVTVALLFQWQVVYPRFAQLELAAAGDDLGRVEQALQRRIETLDATARDYATWDDAWNFVTGEQNGFAETNFTADVSENFGLNLMAILESSGRVMEARRFDEPGNPPTVVSSTDLEALVVALKLQVQPLGEKSISGLCQTTAGLMMVAARPVLHSDGKGEPAAWLVTASYLDQAEQAALQETTRVRFELQPINSAEPVSALATSVSDRESVGVFSQDAAEIRMQIELHDVAGRPLVRLITRTPRTVTSAGRQTLITVSTLLIGVILVFSLALLFALDRLVLRPVESLSQFMKNVGAKGMATTNRADLSGNDELAHLAAELNAMLDRLDQAAKDLAAGREREAEMETIRKTTATYAHEINNPLAGVIGSIQLFQDNGLLPDERRQMLAEMMRASYRIRDVVSQMEHLNKVKVRDVAGHEIYDVRPDLN